VSAPVLKSCSLFVGFQEAGLLILAKLFNARTIQAGSPIFVENMMAESMFVIKVGIVRLCVKDTHGQDQVLEKLTAGESFGEMSLVFGGHRLVSAIAETDCQLLELSRRDFVKLQKQKPQLFLKLMLAIVGQLGKKLRESSDIIKSLLLSQLSDQP
jgi:CRP/FNR family transcriptional regulator, cyclic AMP receptor protein